MENTHILNKLLEKIESLEKEVKILRQEVRGNSITYPTYTPAYNPNPAPGSELILGGAPSEIVLQNYNHTGRAPENDGSITINNIDSEVLTFADVNTSTSFIGYNQPVDNS